MINDSLCVLEKKWSLFFLLCIVVHNTKNEEEMRTEGTKILAEMIRTNTTLTVLDLGGYIYIYKGL